MVFLIFVIEDFSGFLIIGYGVDLYSNFVFIRLNNIKFVFFRYYFIILSDVI